MSLLEIMSDVLAPAVMTKASGSLCEPLSAVERGVAAALSTVLAKASTIAATDAADTLAQLLRNHAVDCAVLDDLASVFGGEGVTPNIRNRGQPAVAELFGQHAAAVESSLAAFAGIRHSSANSLLTMAVPVVLGFLARYQRRQGVSAAGLARVVAWQRDSLTHVLPASISGAIGFVPATASTSR